MRHPYLLEKWRRLTA